jgi:CRP-like cAMP-binding protein
LGDSTIAAQFCERLAKALDLAPGEMRDLLELRTRLINYRAGQMISADHETVAPIVVLSGWLSVQRILEDGQRQIFDIFSPYDSVGLSQQNGRPFAVSVVALTEIIALDGSNWLRYLARRSSGSGHTTGALELKTEVRLYEHIARLGRCRSYERLAHFFGNCTRDW